jgi:signal transduction histidine kinase
MSHSGQGLQSQGLQSQDLQSQPSQFQPSQFQPSQFQPSHPESSQLERPVARSIHPGSQLKDLPLHCFTIDLADAEAQSFTGTNLAAAFHAAPQVPAVVLVESDAGRLHQRLVGVVVRSSFFELMVDGNGCSSSFLQQSLRAFLPYLGIPVLKLAGEMTILVSAQRALRRPEKSLGDPVLVELGPGQYGLLDFHTLNIAYWQIRGIETQIAYEQMHLQMIRNDKMASLGRLVNGVSHEILDPVSFIWGNLSHLSSYVKDVMQVLDRYELELPAPSETLMALRSDLEIEYLREDIPRTLQSIKTGADRLTKLASSLQNFCHIDEVYPKATDMHDCLDSVLLLLKSHLKGEIQVEKSYGPLPTVACFVGQVTQVFLNVLSYLVRQVLAQSVADRVLADLPLPQGELGITVGVNPNLTKPQLSVITEVCSIDVTGMRWASICLGCNGEPISMLEQQQLLRDFTHDNPLTRESSLVMAYRVVTIRHQGILKIRTASNPADHLNPGISTEFEVLIPIGL